MLICAVCEKQFERRATRGPIPRFCSQPCATRAKRTPRRVEYERNYRRTRRANGLDLTDNKARRDYYRERWRRLYGDKFSHVTIQNPYVGHRWFDMARAAVTSRDISPEYRDFGYDDEVGEALLALLEGRDPVEAVKKYRSSEFIPRHMTIFTSEWHGDDDWKNDRFMPSSPSAEEEVMAVVSVGAVAARYDRGKNRRRFGNNKGRQQPHRRRMKDGKSWRKHLGKAG